ncbi:hypothetical protein [Pontibacter chitinilyticus]|uniref:hypothetical protein n=1 Tax=Pontibacter chitinilyticus TaxID=2674989 RepID=UPI00321BE626
MRCNKASIKLRIKPKLASITSLLKYEAAATKYSQKYKLNSTGNLHPYAFHANTSYSSFPLQLIPLHLLSIGSAAKPKIKPLLCGRPAGKV